MTVFGNYARYYDLLYYDKDYSGEAQFIQNLCQKYAPDAKTILELGCGTGTHAILLAEDGYQIHGVDLSEDMLQAANNRRAQLSPEICSRVDFSQSDIRQTRISRTFDVVISLFHVISYQTTNEDLHAAFATVKEHLKPGGVFIFDVWYGPAVLNNKPSIRIKRLEDDAICVTRLAEPVLYPNENLVDVNYQVFIRDKSSNEVEEVRETHQMRYLFKPELELFMAQAKLEMIGYQEWMKQQQPGLDTWGVCFICKSI
jgi:SAM-dependent methyltransferase